MGSLQGITLIHYIALPVQFHWTCAVSDQWPLRFS